MSNSKQGFSSILILVVVLVLIVGASGIYFVLQKKSSDETSSISPSSTIQPIASEQPKTGTGKSNLYENNKFHYSIQYPASITLKAGDSDLQGNKISNPSTGADSSSIIFTDPSTNLLEIKSGPISATLEQTKDILINKVVSSKNDISESLFGGEKALNYTYAQDKYILVIHNQTAYDLHLLRDNELVQEILTSFKFTD